MIRLDEALDVGPVQESPVEALPAVAIAQNILVVGPDDWAVGRAGMEIELAGRTVHRCHESADEPFPCNALVPGRGCPLDREDIDVVLDVRTRPRPEPGMSEMGAICGLRAGRPLVVAGLTDTSSLAPWATKVPNDGDVVTTCDEAMRGRR